MPCFTPEPTEGEKEQWWRDAKKEGRWDEWYRRTPTRALEQWLCDALSGRPPSADALAWHRLHQKHHDGHR